MIRLKVSSWKIDNDGLEVKETKPFAPLNISGDEGYLA
jgi:hypothetical protein